MNYWQRSAKEAKEVFQDPEGRWVSFNVTNESLIFLEKKNLPEHLLTIENLETSVTLQSIIADLQDAGEVTWQYLALEFENANQNCGWKHRSKYQNCGWKHKPKLWMKTQINTNRHCWLRQNWRCHTTSCRMTSAPMWNPLCLLWMIHRSQR